MVTPQTESPEIARELGIGKLYFKREDLHPYGSHKGRSIPHMIDQKALDGATDFAISSSGNAALAAARHVIKKNSEGSNLKLTVYVGERINQDKKAALLSEIKNENVEVKSVLRPLQALFKEVTGRRSESLRQSIDPLALKGYETLAFEIAGTPDASAVFVGTSSGTTAESLANYFSDHKKDIAVFAVQTTTVHPFADEFGKEETKVEPQLADAIVDKVAHRKESLVGALKKTQGKALIATNEEITKAINLLREKAGIEATGNGALGLAGLIHSLSKGKTFKGAVVCIITGK